MVTENNFYWFILGYALLANFFGGGLGWIIEKCRWWYADKSLEGYAPEESFSKEYFEEKYEIKLTDTETYRPGFIFETLHRMCFFLYEVMMLGGIGGILGMILAANFGHEEIFVWPGFCLGAIIGAVSASFFLVKNQTDHSKNAYDSLKKLQIKVNQPLKGLKKFVTEVPSSGVRFDAQDLPSFPALSQNSSSVSNGKKNRRADLKQMQLKMNLCHYYWTMGEKI